ncbi:MAG: flavodoxin domain-containing protein [Eubacteriales bacterium]
MEIGLVYATKTNHSKMIAESIAAALKIEAKNAAQHPDYENLDLLFLVGGIYGKKSLPEMMYFVNMLNPGKVKKVALITSCVSKKMYQEDVRKQLTENGVKIADEFMCQGSFLCFGLGHPDKKEIEDAVAFAKSTISKSSAQSH